MSDVTGTVLIVEDSHTILEYIGQLLRESGYDVLLADGGVQAVELYSQYKPDLVLLDIIMPGKDGYETCSDIMKIGFCPIIFMSSLSTGVDKAKGFRVGGVDYITKPIEPVELLSRINTHITLSYLRRELQADNLMLEQKIKERSDEITKLNHELKEVESWFNSLFDNSPVAMLYCDFSLVKWDIGILKRNGIFDPDAYLEHDIDGLNKLAAAMKIIDINLSMIKLYKGKDKKSVSDFIFRTDDDNIKLIRSILKIIWSGDISNELECTIKDSFGNVVDMIVHWTVPPDYVESFEKCYIAFTDVTILKNIESELGRTKNYHMNLLNSIDSAIIGFDDNLNVVYRNDVSCRILGDCLKTGDKLITGMLKDFSGIDDVIKQSMSNKKIISKKSAPIHLDGRIIYYEFTVYPMTGGGNGGGMLKIDDITERIKLNEIFAGSEKMVHIAGISAGIVHEIKNPLSIISTSVQNLENRLAPDKAANREAAAAEGVDLDRVAEYFKVRGLNLYIDNIKESVGRTSTIVKDLLNFSRNGNRDFSQFNINSLIEDALNLAGLDYQLNKNYDFKSVSIVKNFDNNIPALMINRVELEQVIFNLIKNSVQAMHEKSGSGYKPEITITTSSSNDFVEIEIKDNGTGIESDKIDRIFEPFYTTKEPDKGTGLGLAVTRYIIEDESGGEIKASSSPGEWTSFKIKLPVKKT